MRFAGWFQSIWQVSLNIFGACFKGWSWGCSVLSTLPSFCKMRSTVSIHSSAPRFIRWLYTHSTLASSGMGRRLWLIIRPVSMSSSRKKVVTPVSVSPLMTAQLIGAAPRYCGSRAACTLKVPKRGRFHTCLGSIRKATTTCRWASKARSWHRKSSSFMRSGCNTGIDLDRAYCLTGGA